MTDTDLVALPQDTVTLLKRRQVVASMCSAVKELVENSRCQLANLTIVSRTEAELAATKTVQGGPGSGGQDQLRRDAGDHRDGGQPVLQTARQEELLQELQQ